MDGKIEKAIEDVRLASKALLQEIISVIFNNAPIDKLRHQEVEQRYLKAEQELKKLGLSLAIEEFEFKYSVYEKIRKQKNKQTKTTKLVVTQEDNKFLESLKIVPPEKES